MYRCISYWSFEGGLEGKAKIKDVIPLTKKLGFDGLELCLDVKGELGINISDKKIKEIVKIADSEGVLLGTVASGIYWNYPMSAPDKKIRQKSLDITKKMIEITAAVGAKVLLVVPGAVDVLWVENFKPVSYDEVYKRAQEGVYELLKVAEKNKVIIGIENVWNKFLLSPLEMKLFVDSFYSAYVKVYFDIGNVLLTGYPDQWIKILGERIAAIHVKDFKKSVGTLEGFCWLGEGDVDFKAVIKALKEIGYNWTLTAEMLPPAKGLLEHTIEFMKKTIK